MAQIAVTLLVFFSVVAAVWVFLDARARLRMLPAAAWAVGTLIAVGLVGPVYLLTRPPKNPMWGLGEVLAVMLFFVTAVPLLGAVLIPQAETPPSLGVIAALAVVQNAVFVAAVLYIVRIKYRLPLSRVGLAGGRWSRRLWQGAVAGTLAVMGNTLGQNVTVYALSLAMGQQAANEFVTREEVRAPIYRLLPHLHDRLGLLLVVVLIGVVVPIGEEVFFRGLAYGALRRVMNRHGAAVLSALFFAGAHLQPVAILPILILGVILAYLYDYTGSLVPGMIAHAVNNLAALAEFYRTPSL